MRIEKKHLISIGILAVLTIGPYMPAILGFVRMVGGDMTNQSIPWRTFIIEQFRDGRLPLWRPDTFSGTPIFADIQAAIFYPIDWLALLIPLETYLPITYALHTFITALAMYIWLYRKTGSPHGALVSGLVWSWCGFTATNVMTGFVGTALAALYLPLLLLFVDLLIERKRILFLICLIVTFSMQLLAGHPQPVVFSFYFVLAYVIWRMVILYRQKAASLKFGILIVACVPLSMLCMGLITAVSSLPLMELADFSAARSGGVSYEFATSYSLPFSGLIIMVSPFVFGHPLDGTYWATFIGYQEICGYLGVLPLFLSLFALKKRPERKFLILAAISALLLAFGSNAPFFRFAYNFLPGFKWFRVPARFLMLWSFCIAALAGLGVSDLFQAGDRKWNLTSKISLVLLMTICLALFLASILFSCQLWNPIYDREARIHTEAFGVTSPTELHESIRLRMEKRAGQRVDLFMGGTQQTLILGIVSFLLIVLVKKKQHLAHPLLYAGLALLIVDLGGFNISVKNYMDTDEYDMKVYRESKTVRFLKEDESVFRILCTDDVIQMHSEKHPEMYPERLAVHGIQTVRGYNPTVLKHYAEYINTMIGAEPEGEVGGLLFLPDATKMNRRMLNELNVKYLLTYNKEVPTGFRKILTDMDLGVYENLEAYPRAYVARNDTLADDPVTLTKYLPNIVKVEASAVSPGVLVLADTWYPGWTATVDGEEADLERYHGIFRGVQLSEGEHEVVFRFRPKSFFMGLSISILSLLALLIVTLATRGKRMPWVE